jgi:hypothetical protein
MNVVEFKSKSNPIAFCFIDNIHQYKSAWTQELIKNLSDYTISNLSVKGYDVYQSESEDDALSRVVEMNYTHAVVFSTGTEFINGRDFFKEIESLVKTDFYVYGHILDRGDAYYELHHQCYLINLKKYQELGCPEIGQTKLGNSHQTQVPRRSMENIHDNYTPLWIEPGNYDRVYNHKLHGWNLVSKILAAGGTVYAFDEKIRNNKKHYYPEAQIEFLKHVSWAYSRYQHCANEFIHTSNTELVNAPNNDYEQIITPASGTWFVDYIKTDHPVTVVYYDYNQKSLDYWQANAPVINNVTYKFVKVDLLGKYSVEQLIVNLEKKTLINLSNIFCYEGTAMFSSLEYRLQKEIELINMIPANWTIVSSMSSTQGFTNQQNNVKLVKLTKPTWHYNGDWNE